MLHQNRKLSVAALFWYDYCKKKYGKTAPVYNMKAYGGVKAYLHSFLNLTLGRDECSASHPVQFTPGVKTSQYPLNKRLDWAQKVKFEKR